jgi:hypothetical protein
MYQIHDRLWPKGLWPKAQPILVLPEYLPDPETHPNRDPARTPEPIRPREPKRRHSTCPDSGTTISGLATATDARLGRSGDAKASRNRGCHPSIQVPLDQRIHGWLGRFCLKDSVIPFSASCVDVRVVPAVDRRALEVDQPGKQFTLLITFLLLFCFCLPIAQPSTKEHPGKLHACSVDAVDRGSGTMSPVGVAGVAGMAGMALSSVARLRPPEEHSP